MKGALVGWRWTRAGRGEVLTIQVARSVADHVNQDWQQVHLALNERQLRSLARDITRRALSHKLDLRSRPSLWRRLLQGPRGRA